MRSKNNYPHVDLLCISQSDCIKKSYKSQKNRFEAKLTSPIIRSSKTLVNNQQVKANKRRWRQESNSTI